MQLEDAYAACLFNNWQFSLLLDDCKNTQLWTCADCQAAYKAWLCASIFPRCSGSPEQRVPTCRNTCFVCPPFRQALLLSLTKLRRVQHMASGVKQIFSCCGTIATRFYKCLSHAGGGAEVPHHQPVHLPSE